MRFFSRVLGSVHSFEIWEKIHDYFYKQTRAKARQLRYELRATTLSDRSMSKYLLRIEALVDSLASVGDPISLQEHVDVILEGLLEEFSSMISVIENTLILLT